MGTDSQEIRELLDERAIRKVLHLYCRGIDRLDRELVASCYHADATDEHGSFSGGVDGFLDWSFRLLERYERTQHFLGSSLVEFGAAGSGTARVESYGVAVHVTPGGPPEHNLTTGFRFIDRFEARADGVWRIASRVATTEWVRASAAEEDWPIGEHLRQGRRDREDPIYDPFERS